MLPSRLFGMTGQIRLMTVRCVICNGRSPLRPYSLLAVDRRRIRHQLGGLLTTLEGEASTRQSHQTQQGSGLRHFRWVADSNATTGSGGITEGDIAAEGEGGGVISNDQEFKVNGVLAKVATNKGALV
jgi:hypothetical protein